MIDDPLFHIVAKDYRAIVLQDLPRELILGGRCARCERVGPIDRLRVERRWPAEPRLAVLDAHLRCIECRNVEQNRFTVYGRLGGVQTKPAAAPRRRDAWSVDLYSEGSCVYRVDSKGDVLEIAAWAPNSLIAAAAFDALCKQYPADRFSRRRRSWVEADSGNKPETSSLS